MAMKLKASDERLVHTSTKRAVRLPIRYREGDRVVDGHTVRIARIGAVVGPHSVWENDLWIAAVGDTVRY